MGETTSKLEFLRGTLDVLILKALLWVPLHGYAITNLIRRQSDDALVVEAWGLSENNRKAKFYCLTTAGRRHLREEVKTWETYAEAVAKVLGATRPSLREELG